MSSQAFQAFHACQALQSHGVGCALRLRGSSLQPGVRDHKNREALGNRPNAEAPSSKADGADWAGMGGEGSPECCTCGVERNGGVVPAGKLLCQPAAAAVIWLARPPGHGCASKIQELDLHALKRLRASNRAGHQGGVGWLTASGMNCIRSQFARIGLLPTPSQPRTLSLPFSLVRQVIAADFGPKTGRLDQPRPDSKRWRVPCWASSLASMA
ncbi:uncharacterized protein B0H64DRAFT_1861 [Chaetomium fimeti]|uniref:Uncharacterized protein n=1 Tax=Chaetomium fimeti TaxID=1854472 RepID=A0AAE0HNP5_9PEZI|nr:hypothetical protein B0H64DRAFT_1861 [Chaetomium fimeti]